jgi:hypothetical protein
MLTKDGPRKDQVDVCSPLPLGRNIPMEGLAFLSVSKVFCSPPGAATLLPGDRPVQATWDLEMGRVEQELPGVSGGQWAPGEVSGRRRTKDGLIMGFRELDVQIGPPGRAGGYLAWRLFKLPFNCRRSNY